MSAAVRAWTRSAGRLVLRAVLLNACGQPADRPPAPTAAAWDLGAATWGLAERASFANDPDLELIVVSGGALAVTAADVRVIEPVVAKWC